MRISDWSSDVCSSDLINIALTRISGIDVGMGGSYSTSIGEFEPSLAATYMYQYDEKLSPNSPLRSNLAVRQSTGWAPRWKIVPRIGWSYQEIVYASLAGRYVSEIGRASCRERVCKYV